MFLSLRPSNDPAIIEATTGARLSFAAVLDAGAAVGARMGRRKALLFLLARNDSFSLTTYFGAIAAGHAVALLDGSASAELTASLVRQYQPEWLAGTGDPAVGLSEHDVPIAERELIGDGWLIRTGYRPTAIHPDLALLLTTSGTTGSSKFVRLSVANIQANADSISTYLGLTPDERAITSLPIHYSFGLSVVNSHWRSGAPVIVTANSVVESAFWEAFRDHAATSLAGVPFTYLLLERIGFRTMDTPSLRHLQQAGGRLDPKVIATYGQHMAERRGRFFVMYGQTEATARMSFVPPERLAEKLGSVGIAIPGGRLSIEAQAEAADGTGEVVYEGPNVMLGYAEGTGDLSLGDVMGGVLHTGDLGYLDDDGFLYIVGRSKRIGKVFGLRINLDEIESLLRRHGPAAVVAGDDVVLGFCEFGTGEDLDQLGRSLARSFKLNHAAIRLQRIDAIPTTSSGKIDYRALERSL